MLLAYDGSQPEAARLSAEARCRQRSGSGALGEDSVAENCSPVQRGGFRFEIVDVCGMTNFARLELLRELLPPSRLDQDAASLLALVAAPCWFVTADGVVGPLLEPDGSPGNASSMANLDLLLREVSYLSGLEQLPGPFEAARALAQISVDECLMGSEGCWEQRALATSQLLEEYGVAVLPGFLGAAGAAELAAMDFGELLPAAGLPAAPGAGRGDLAALPEESPQKLLEGLDCLVVALRQLPSSLAAARLRLVEFRTCPMVSAYEAGSRYTWHLDNGKRGNGRLLTCVYYLNPSWEAASGGALRLLERSRPGASSQNRDASPEDLPSSRSPPVPRARVLAEVPPLLDTLVLFWSDEVVHEVLPPFRMTRRAISVWYLCPLLGTQHFLAGTSEPAFGRSEGDAALTVLSNLSESESNVCEDAVVWLTSAAEPSTLSWLINEGGLIIKKLKIP
ncbi:unnamed protein product [Polarella glacialis]|uniref:Fe2OG dioxygenase domain-containing protein n=1 Tax=Polarella glacialis TaxID=89957 RepID=A0A813FUB3_POLGL|nr:unnamed protein product [Polarella glacialis]